MCGEYSFNTKGIDSFFRDNTNNNFIYKKTTTFHPKLRSSVLKSENK